MTDSQSKDIETSAFVNQLYDIALDPQSLELFIDAWNNAGLDASAARQTIKDIDVFDDAYQAHLNRAETFLSRAAERDGKLSLAATLTPFNSLAAFIVSRDLTVLASNQGAQSAFEISDGLNLSDMRLQGEALEALAAGVRDVFLTADRPDRLLNIEFGGQLGPALFQIRRVGRTTQQTDEHALVVTTRYHWQTALGDTLQEVFGLTAAEQGVVRALVEGLDAKTISAERGTSEGTVRGQIKSILSKMHARTQSEVIRLVLSLRDVSNATNSDTDIATQESFYDTTDWLTVEVWKPFKSVTLPDGRRLDYHDMGPATGAPVLYSHMGYGLARWHKPMLKLAFQHGLRVICPIRAGYGQSDNLDPKADVLASTRDDTLFLLNQLGIARLPYLTQGNDLLFAADFAAHHPKMISEIIGICARPCLPGDQHYSGMAKWHRFFLSTARHAPHLLKFTTKAAVALAKRIGVIEMYRQMNQRSPADIALMNIDELRPVLLANAELIAGETTDVAQAYTMEVLATEADWSHLLMQCASIKTWFVNGAEDPATDIATIAEYREAYPWIKIEVVSDAGQLLLYQHFGDLIGRIADAAKAAH
ncbi:MAG: LuxR C-terminal-related transcriptional regulator [Alphaproteobacteria bacterium]|nr:LuxR C-terminal-related transcriptional regulator [Alphaproteobacteria bacterium]